MSTPIKENKHLKIYNFFQIQLILIFFNKIKIALLNKIAKSERSRMFEKKKWQFENGKKITH
jgi:hypothetical protein